MCMPERERGFPTGEGRHHRWRIARPDVCVAYRRRLHSKRGGSSPGAVPRHYRVYSVAMAKVMVSLPDDLLDAVDAEAARRGTTRSGLLRRFADEALRRRGAARAARIEELMRDSAAHGGSVVEVLRRHRPRR